MQGNAGLSEASAIVVDNDVTMSAPEGTVFGANSEGSRSWVSLRATWC